MGHELRYKLVIWPPEPPGDPASWPQLLLEDVTSRPHLADAEGRGWQLAEYWMKLSGSRRGCYLFLGILITGTNWC